MKIDHWQHVALIIRAQIDISEGKFDEDDLDMQLEENLEVTSGVRQFRNIVLGARQKPLSFGAIESLHSEDPAFKGFQERFCIFLSMALLPEKTVSNYMSIFTQEAKVSQIILQLR